MQLDDESLEQHKNERRVRAPEDDDVMSVADSMTSEAQTEATVDDDNDNLSAAAGDVSSESDDDVSESNVKLKNEDDEEDEVEEASFPDTSLALQHVKGGK